MIYIKRSFSPILTALAVASCSISGCADSDELVLTDFNEPAEGIYEGAAEDLEEGLISLLMPELDRAVCGTVEAVGEQNLTVACQTRCEQFVVDIDTIVVSGRYDDSLDRVEKASLADLSANQQVAVWPRLADETCADIIFILR